MKEEMTIDELAQIIKSGFDETATKTKLHVLKTELHVFIEQTDQNFEVIRENMQSLKRDLIAAVLAIHDEKVEELEKRITRLEKKVGLEA